MERQPPIKEEMKDPDMGMKGEPPPWSRPAPAKPGYGPVAPDDSRPVAAEGISTVPIALPSQSVAAKDYQGWE